MLSLDRPHAQRRKAPVRLIHRSCNTSQSNASVPAETNASQQASVIMLEGSPNSRKRKRMLLILLTAVLGAGGIVILVASTHHFLESNASVSSPKDSATKEDPSSTNPKSQDSPSGGSDNPQQQAYYKAFDRPIRVACAGDSLTFGAIGTVPGDDYPSQLRQILGDAFEIHNYGVNSVTAIRGLRKSYNDTRAFQDSLSLQADIYLIMLGTNDSKFWAQNGHRFPADMEWIVQRAAAPTKVDASPARILLAIPPWVKKDYGSIKNDVLVNDVQPAIREFASAHELQLVDMYAVTQNRDDFYIGDNLHLTAKGYKSLAEAWERAVRCNRNGVCEVGEDCGACPEDCRLNCP